MTNIAFFEPISDTGRPGAGLRYRPTPFAASLWAPGTLNGPAVCGLAARAVETEFGDDEFVPARCTIDRSFTIRNFFPPRPTRSGI